MIMFMNLYDAWRSFFSLSLSFAVIVVAAVATVRHTNDPSIMFSRLHRLQF